MRRSQSNSFDVRKVFWSMLKCIDCQDKIKKKNNKTVF